MHRTPRMQPWGLSQWVFISSTNDEINNLLHTQDTLCLVRIFFPRAHLSSGSSLNIFQIILQTGFYPTFTGYNQNTEIKKKKNNNSALSVWEFFSIAFRKYFFNKLPNYPEMKKCGQYTHTSTTEVKHSRFWVRIKEKNKKLQVHAVVLFCFKAFKKNKKTSRLWSRSSPTKIRQIRFIMVD